jgi:apolipoprotein D and lipocalin family protein
VLCALAVTASRADSVPPATVATVDLQRYVGRWYEIAKIPNRFQKQCTRGTTAEYTLRADGRIEVLNRCTRADGQTDEAKGVAKVADRDSNSKLKVSFVRFLGVQLFWGDYWIIGLGADYEYAIVGSPDRKYAWLLSRTPDLSSDVLEAAFGTLRAQGYDPSRFEMTTQ